MPNARKRLPKTLRPRSLASHYRAEPAQCGLFVPAARQTPSTLPFPHLPTHHIPRMEDSKMNKKIAALTLASLVTTCSHYAFAAETTQESALPPDARYPGVLGKLPGGKIDVTAAPWCRAAAE